jgi:hypothetical protein
MHMHTDQARRRREFFIYAPPVLEDFSSVVLPIDTDAEFELMKLAHFSEAAGGEFAFGDPQTEETRILPLLELQILDTGTGRNVFSAFVPFAALFGDGKVPFVLPTTKIFARQSKLEITVQPVDDAVANNFRVRLALIGEKIFTY